MKPFFHRFLPVLTAALLLSGCAGNPAEDTTTFTVTFFKLGKADGMVLQTENHTALIDCGEKSDADTLAEFLDAAGIETIDCIILTHYDQDHIGGAAALIEDYNVLEVIVPDYIEDSKEYRKYTETMQEKGLSQTVLTQEMSFTLDDVEFTVYPHESDDYDESFDNNCSLITKVTHQENVFLFTGDACEERLSEVMDIGTCDLLKVPYHGRKVSNLGAFLDSVQPSYAVISTSKKELSDDTVQCLEERGITSYVTCQDGNITAVSDGESIEIHTDKE
jgi:beta-lactamase superfamily II metal-dependent hydrolase